MPGAAKQDGVVVDAVIVSYNSGSTLRACVEPLCAAPRVGVTVVDNASPEGRLETVADLPINIIRSGRNGGFAYGCNLGAASGGAPYVLLLNPDATITADGIDQLVRVLEREPAVALAAPRIVDAAGDLEWSQRRFPTLASTFAYALFLHRLMPRSSWVDELVRRAEAYEQPGSPDWVSGACMLIRREALDAVGGLDERFFLYCEDTDLCRRLRDAGYTVRYQPAAEAKHVGGVSSPSSRLRAVLAASRIGYARKHSGDAAAVAHAVCIAVGEAVHALASLRRPSSRRGHAAALRAALSAGRDPLAGFEG